MKTFNRKKSVLERGGLMIEALAMLGLIAVVTPTMYKKSAERTLEVEDINTATTMRTVMNAAEAFMSSNYADIMKVMEEDTSHQHTVGENDNQQTIGVMDIPMADLAPYLPYKFNENNALYNYNTPKIRIVRAGDNLTAFALFPAKVDEEDGIGQERTVRIASLIGANGGYVSDSGKSARGVGGVWNLDGNYYKEVFKDKEGNEDGSYKYSVVTSSSNVVNGSNAMAESDPTQFLQRYKQSGMEWRNAMRTDLYMGYGVNNTKDPDDPTHASELFSIRNINNLIVGTKNNDDPGAHSLNDAAGTQNGIDEASKKMTGEYGLYIVGSGSQGAESGNAYIHGTILAAGNKFWASKDYLKYTGTNLEFDGTNFRIGKEKDDTYTIDGYSADGKSTLNIMTDKIQVAQENKLGDYGNKKANIAMTAGKPSASENPKVKAPEYDTTPDFGVDIDADVVIEGRLAAGQLDVNQIRTANIAVGSKHIDDKYKWMEVGEKGVYVHQPEHDSKYQGTQIVAKEKLIAMRAGADVGIDGDITKDHKKLKNEYPAQIIMSEDGIVEKVKDDKDLILANNKIGVQLNDKTINIGNKNLINKADIAGTEDYKLVVGKGGDVDVQASNLMVTDGTNPVLTVRGKDSLDTAKADAVTDNKETEKGKYNIAVHGNALFTDKADDYRYLAAEKNLPQSVSNHAAVNIVAGSSNAGDASRGIMYVDMEPLNIDAYTHEPGNNSSVAPAESDTNPGKSRSVAVGGIYIRKGLIDIVPSKDYVNRYDTNSPDPDMIGSHTADDGIGIIRASRFVANNVDKGGHRIVVPDFFTAKERERYNNSNFNPSVNYTDQNKTITRYDTYMVNPAYTSVMNDIKLVSRGGARLSDILPVFVTKGIYTAVNNVSEVAYSGDTHSHKGVSLEPSNLWLVNKNGKIGLNIDRSLGQNNWRNYSDEPASPIIGVVPAPQCPPGYARMIMVTPASIRMSEAGRFKNAETGQFKGYAIDVDDFTNPTTQDYLERTKPDGTKTLIWVDQFEDASLTDAEKQKLGMSLQLYNAYINSRRTASDGETVYLMSTQNPAYLEGVHLAGGTECWEWDSNGNCTNYGHYERKMEMHVAGYGNGNRNQTKVLSNKEQMGNQKNEIAVGTSESVWEAYRDSDKEQGGTIVRTDDVNEKHKANIVKDKINFEYLDRDEEYWGEKSRPVGVINDIDLSNSRLLIDRMKNVSVRNRNNKEVYMLTSDDKDAFAPITFQKSTWLKTAAIPLRKEKNSALDKENDYASGWAILMGFLYPQHGYRAVLNTLNVKENYHTYPMFEKATEKYASGFDEQDIRNRHRGNEITAEKDYFFWNVFPVEQESLEAFVTTYCYFDQDNKAFGTFNETSDVQNHLPMIDYINTFPSSYAPEGNNKKYRQLMNDPSMKYNELW